MVSLRDIAPAAHNNIDAQFIVLDKSRATAEGGHRTCLALVADETAAVHFQFWGDECEAFEPGDVVRLSKGIFSFNRSKQLVLRAGRRGSVCKVGEFTMVFVETPNMSEVRWALDPSNRSRLHSVLLRLVKYLLLLQGPHISEVPIISPEFLLPGESTVVLFDTVTSAPTRVLRPAHRCNQKDFTIGNGCSRAVTSNGNLVKTVPDLRSSSHF